MQLFLIAAFIAVAAAGNVYHSGYAQPHIAIVRQSDERHGVQSSQWSYEGSDGTTRQESNAQKHLSGYGASNGYGDNYFNGGNTNQGTVYWISPEGERVTLSWVADELGFRPTGSHIPQPVAPQYTRSGY